jgi:hypothetical protein
MIDSELDDLREKEDGQSVVAERVIDGDTIVINGKSIRLLGINSPERGEYFYDEAKDFLESLVLNENIEIESYGKDKYYRVLAYVFVDNKNINVEMVEKGFANVYLLDEKYYKRELRSAWKNCVKENFNLCEISNNKCSNCVELEGLDIKEQKVVFYNKCDFDCDLSDWEIKEEGRGKMVLKDDIKKKNYLDIKTKNMWERTGDTLFLRDNEGKLVLYYSY